VTSPGGRVPVRSTSPVLGTVVGSGAGRPKA
jgi:hypothetical protein